MVQKNRLLQGNRDMFWSLVPLVIVCIIFAVISGNIAFKWGSADRVDKMPPYAVTPVLRSAARTVDFDLRLPDLPSTWKPNSGSRDNIGSSVVQNSGWVTPSGAYMQLSQTNANISDLVSYLQQDARVPMSGKRDINGVNWTMFDQKGAKSLWAAHMGSTSIGLYGLGSSQEFTLIATAIVGAKPLPKT